MHRITIEGEALSAAVWSLACILHEGNEAQGKYGKQGWSIVRRCIAVAMDQGGSIKIGRQIIPEFVQVQTVFPGMHDFCIWVFEFID